MLAAASPFISLLSVLCARSLRFEPSRFIAKIPMRLCSVARSYCDAVEVDSLCGSGDREKECDGLAGV